MKMADEKGVQEYYGCAQKGFEAKRQRNKEAEMKKKRTT